MVNKRINLKYAVAKDLLQEGDVLLFRGAGFFSRFIKGFGQGDYSHVGVASSHGVGDNKYWECVEFREWVGGRTVNLLRYVYKYDGIIDVYRPISSHKIVLFDGTQVTEKDLVFDGLKVTDTIRHMTGLPYGWLRIWWILKRELDIFNIFHYNSPTTIDDVKEDVYPVCSTAVAYAFSKSGYDLTPNRSDEWMQPSDISRSALIQYIFTIQF